ncbi:MAG: DMT family transporter [Leptolyngbyaceae cyanobacterium SL_7_1]|nr:DMT family transporter [Leptolyngbyaceae cyanobacterium SL_7_1]
MPGSPTPPSPPTKFQVGLVLITGVLAVSAAAVFIVLAIEASGGGGVGFSLFLSATRLTIASLVLIPVWRTARQSSPSSIALWYAIAAGVCLALHFATWITSLSLTSIVASATLVTTNPIWVALISWLWFREMPTRLTGLGIGVALVGGILIASGNSDITASQPVVGNLLALAGAMMASFYFLLGREAQRHGLTIGRYAAIAYTTGAIVLLPLPPLIGISYWGFPTAVYLYTLLMTLSAQVVGHTALNWSVRWTSPTLVALMLLFEPVGASILGYLIFQQAPGQSVLLGAGIVLLGVAIAVLGEWQDRATETPPTN